MRMRSKALRQAKVRASEAQRRNSEDRHWRRTVLVPTVSSLVAALLGTLVGAGVTAWSTQRTLAADERQAARGLQEERLQAARPERRAAYLAMLNAVDAWSNSLRSLAECRDDDAYGPKAPAAPLLAGECKMGASDNGERLESFTKALTSYLAVQDQFVIVASPRVASAERSLRASLDAYLATLLTKGITEYEVDAAYRDISVARAKFQSGMCLDINPEAQGCYS
jgi:hypothetical protein